MKMFSSLFQLTQLLFSTETFVDTRSTITTTETDLESFASTMTFDDDDFDFHELEIIRHVKVKQSTPKAGKSSKYSKKSEKRKSRKKSKRNHRSERKSKRKSKKKTGEKSGAKPKLKLDLESKEGLRGMHKKRVKDIMNPKKAEDRKQNLKTESISGAEESESHSNDSQKNKSNAEE